MADAIIRNVEGQSQGAAVVHADSTRRVGPHAATDGKSASGRSLPDRDGPAQVVAPGGAWLRLNFERVGVGGILGIERGQRRLSRWGVGANAVEPPRLKIVPVKGPAKVGAGFTATS